MDRIKSLCVIVAVGSLFTACISSKKLTEQSIYFRNISDSILQRKTIEFEPILQKGDILSISVLTPNENSSRLFNQRNPGIGAVSTETGSNLTSSGGGYLINERGDIALPYLGFIKAEGLSIMSLEDSLTRKLRVYIDSAIVTIRLINYRITVLGEVTKPGTFTIPSERVSVLDAIGLAGDLTVYAKRDNIRIIRQVDGIRETTTLDINKGDIFGSPFFYLRQNDIVYVEMNNRKISGTDQATLRGLSTTLGIISALGVIISTINVLKR